MNTRCELRDIATRCVDSLFHHAKNVQTRTFSLIQRHLHDLFSDAFDFDIHLQRSDTFTGTGYFEVHVAQVVFITQNIGQYDKVFAFFHQTHRNTRDSGFNRHARVHQRQRSATHGSHGRRTIGFGDFRHHADGVREAVSCRHDCQYAAFRQTTVTDFTTLRRTNHAGFADRVRREVVVEQEAVSTLAHQFVDVLRVAFSTERRGNQRLRFTTGEERGTVSTRQYASAHVQATDHVFFATIDTRFASQYARTNNVLLDSVQDVAQLVFVKRVAFGLFSLQCRDNVCFDSVDLAVTFLFVSDAVRVAQTRFSQRFHARVKRFVSGFRLPVPARFARFFHQIVDVLNHNLLLLVAEHHGAQHLIFAQQFSFRFHHQHGAFSTSDNQIQFAGFQLILGRVQYVLVVDVTHARGTNRAVERNTGQRQRSGRADHRNNIRVNLRVNGNDGRDNLNFVNEAFREQRAERAVNQTRDQRFAFARTAFATEEAARDAASSVGTLLIVNGQREKVLARLRFFSANYGHEYRSVIHAYHHGSSGLTSHHSGFKSDSMLTILKFADDRIKQNYTLSK
ncbi:Spidroin 1 [Cronobacter sakazakii 701]|nr:Spidroin 1 [Cronobacter sakazakii 701]